MDETDLASIRAKPYATKRNWLLQSYSSTSSLQLAATLTINQPTFNPAQPLTKFNSVRNKGLGSMQSTGRESALINALNEHISQRHRERNMDFEGVFHAQLVVIPDDRSQQSPEDAEIEDPRPSLLLDIEPRTSDGLPNDLKSGAQVVDESFKFINQAKYSSTEDQTADSLHEINVTGSVRIATENELEIPATIFEEESTKLNDVDDVVRGDPPAPSRTFNMQEVLSDIKRIGSIRENVEKSIQNNQIELNSGGQNDAGVDEAPAEELVEPISPSAHPEKYFSKSEESSWTKYYSTPPWRSLASVTTRPTLHDLLDSTYHTSNSNPVVMEAPNAQPHTLVEYHRHPEAKGADSPTSSTANWQTVSVITTGNTAPIECTPPNNTNIDTGHADVDSSSADNNEVFHSAQSSPDSVARATPEPAPDYFHDNAENTIPSSRIPYNSISSIQSDHSSRPPQAHRPWPVPLEAEAKLQEGPTRWKAWTNLAFEPDSDTGSNENELPGPSHNFNRNYGASSNMPIADHINFAQYDPEIGHDFRIVRKPRFQSDNEDELTRNRKFCTAILIMILVLALAGVGIGLAIYFD